MAIHFYKILIYGQVRGYVSASNMKIARKKVLKDKKYSSMLWHGKTGVTNLKLEKEI